MTSRKPNQVQSEITSHIALLPTDWAIATWRPRQPLPRPAIQPFDGQECLLRYRRLVGGHVVYYHPQLNWPGLFEGRGLSPQEAHFWFLALTESPADSRPGVVPSDLQPNRCTGSLGKEEIRQRLRQRAGYLVQEVLVPLSYLLSLRDLFDLMLDDQLGANAMGGQHYQVANLQASLVDGFRRYVLVHLDDAALEQLRQQARARIGSALWSQSAAPTLEQVMAYRLAPLLGMHREMQTLVGTWPRDLFKGRGSYEEWRRWPREIIFGLGDPFQVEQHLRRLGLLLRNDLDVRSWLAHTELRGLDYIRESIVGGPSYHATKLLEPLCMVEAPDVARPLLELRLDGFASSSIQRWFATQVGNGVAGLLPLAGGRGKLADAARNYLREVKRRGFGWVIEKQLDGADAAIANKVQQTVLSVSEAEYPLLEGPTVPIWMRVALQNLPVLDGTSLPEWVVLEDLPPLVVNGRRLTPAHILLLMRILHQGRIEDSPLLVAGLRDHVAVNHRETFAWRVVEQWLCSGAPPRDSWALHAVAWLGSDESVLKLVALMRDWTGQAGRHRSMVVMQALQVLGTPLALQQLSALSRGARTRPLRDCARILLEGAARHRGLSRNELEDQIVPSLGFTGTEGPLFDFGPRQFQAVLAPGLKLLLRDQTGGIRSNLPTPGVRDDRDRASAAIADWRLLRKSLREVYKEQASRFERVMVAGQRWSMRYFHNSILRQPLVTQLARLILWGGFDDRGRLSRTFRINEDLEFVDAQEAPVSLAEVNSVRVIHPIELSEAVRQQWTGVWRDHELISPFPQLGRKLYLLLPEERDTREITRFRGRRIQALTLSAHVKSHDWVPAVINKGQPGEAHRKLFRSAALTAVLSHPNVGQHAYPYHLAEQEMRSVFFIRRMAVEEEVNQDEAIRLGEVPDLVRSEVCETLAWLYGKGKE